MKRIFFLLLLTFSALTLCSQVKPPQGVNAKPFQHEIELTWKAAFHTQWEVTLEGRAPILTSQRNLTFDHLAAGKTYSVQIVAIKDEQRSAPFTTEVSTRPLKYALDSPSRIPYLRTILPDGRAPQQLPLYYEELADEVQAISYQLNGKDVEPQNGCLQLDRNILHNKLVVKITETPERTWTLRYFNISVLY